VAALGLGGLPCRPSGGRRGGWLSCLPLNFKMVCSYLLYISTGRELFHQLLVGTPELIALILTMIFVGVSRQGGP
jgi:hypothetical protein